MLDSLSYTATFATTGRTLSGQFRFQMGLGTITGPNESGKSMLVEMIRYAFFGAAALRGVGADYENLQVSMTWGDYSITRNPSRAHLYREGVEIAVGTRAVNQKVVQVLGFGLDVFDASISANQGQLEALGKMAPAERKRMVDSVIGLGAIEALEKWAGEEALVLTREADAIASTLRQPQEPYPPGLYVRSEIIRPGVAKLEAMQADLARLEGWLSRPVPKPVAPVTPDVTNDREGLLALAVLQDDLQLTLRELARLPSPGDGPEYDFQIDMIEEDIYAYELWQERLAFLRQHPLPTITADELIRLKAERIVWNKFGDLAELDHLISHYRDQGTVTCPNCERSFHLQYETIGEVTTKAQALRKALAKDVCPAEPDDDFIEREEKRHADWDQVDQDEWIPLENAREVPKPNLTRKQIAKLRTDDELLKQRGPLEEKVARLEAEIGNRPAARAQLRELERYADAMVRYAEDDRAWSAWENEAVDKRALADELRAGVANLPTLRQQLEEAVAFEAALVVWEKEKARFDEVSAQVNELRANAAGYKAGKASMALLRSLVKQHLVPSLNKVASNLLRQMTGGQRQTVVVTEDFDITVDGQRLSTLSGSGQAVANLAIRIGLGQVLTNNVLSLFIGDEIDASLDQDRAGNTALCLESLKVSISQIFLVTHKSLAADWAIELTGDTGGQGSAKSGATASR